MAAPNPDAPEILRREILDEARRQEEDILRRAREEADKLIAGAEREAKRLRKEKLDAARAEANRRQEAILATVPIGIDRLRSARIEEVLDSIHDRARDQLRARTGFDFREAIAELAAQALRHMAGDAFVLKLTDEDFSTLGDGFAGMILHHSKRWHLKLRLVADSKQRNGAVVLEDEEGRQLWNIGLEDRLERLWPDLRRQLAAQTSLVEMGKEKGDE